MKIILLILFPFISLAQINVKDLGAKGNGISDDYTFIQSAIDSAVKVNGTVYIPSGKYRISEPLIVHNWNGEKYLQAFCKIIGESTMWDNGNGSVILPDFKDKFGIGIQHGKGVIVQGIYVSGRYRRPVMPIQEFYHIPLNDYGDKSCRDSRYSPYSGIVIDPFGGRTPPDGGWPGMTEWYRGPVINSGSTGIRIEDVTVEKFTVGIIISPNGITRNADILTFQNIRFGDAKIGFAGCHDQEKLNRIINVGCWERVHTLFSWGRYGLQRPGHYIIDGVNIAGGVHQLLERSSSGYFPLFISNVFAETLGRIGQWYSGVGDKLFNSTIDFAFIHETGKYPSYHFKGDGVTIENCSIRYYGKGQEPILFYGLIEMKSNTFYRPPIVGKSAAHGNKFEGYKITKPKPIFIVADSIIDGKIFVESTERPVNGTTVIFMHYGNWEFIGLGVVDSIAKEGYRISNISPSIKTGNVGIGFYQSQSGNVW